MQQVATLAGAAHTAHPFGITMAFESGAQLWWQITAVSAPGDAYSAEEGEPVTGPVAKAPVMPDLAVRPLRTVVVEEALAAGVAAASEEVASVGVFSGLTPVPAVGYGLAVKFHSGATVYVNGLAHVRTGASRPADKFLSLPAEV